jgi:hypothetical protein
MKKISTNKSNNEIRPPLEQLNLATIAVQMMEDIEHIYAQADQQTVRATKKTEIHATAQKPNEVDSWFRRMTAKIRTYPILRCYFLTPANPLAPSFPQRRESSRTNTPRSGQNLDAVPLRGRFSTFDKKPPNPVNPDSINWIPAFAGMTQFFTNGLSGLKKASKTKTPIPTLPIPKDGELFVIASHSKDLRTEIQIRFALQIAITLKQPIILFSASDSFIQFTRKLVGLMANIPSDAAIYDGKLNEDELHRLRAALTQLMTAKVLTYPMQMFGLDEVCNAPRKIHRQIGAIGLVLVDAVQYLADNQRRCVDVKTNLIELKVLADDLKMPVIALYQLDPADENHPSTLTRSELGEIEVLNELTDGFLLMSGTREKLVFATPKIPNAKPVE